MNQIYRLDSDVKNVRYTEGEGIRILKQSYDKMRRSNSLLEQFIAPPARKASPKNIFKTETQL